MLLFLATNIAILVVLSIALSLLGVDTLLDLTTVDLGRDIPRLKQIADRVDINIIVATGVWIAPPSYIRRQSVENLTGMFIHDIEEGIAGTGVRAGAIDVATEPQMDNAN